MKVLGQVGFPILQIEEVSQRGFQTSIGFFITVIIISLSSSIPRDQTSFGNSWLTENYFWFTQGSTLGLKLFEPAQLYKLLCESGLNRFIRNDSLRQKWIWRRYIECLCFSFSIGFCLGFQSFGVGWKISRFFDTLNTRVLGILVELLTLLTDSQYLERCVLIVIGIERLIISSC